MSAGVLRRLIEHLAVAKPGRKTGGAPSRAAKAAFGMDVPIVQVLDHTLGSAAPEGASPMPVDGIAAKV